MSCFVLAKHQGPQHLHGPGTRPKEPLSKKAKTLDVSGADKQVATEQADEGMDFILLVTLLCLSVYKVYSWLIRCRVIKLIKSIFYLVKVKSV